DARSTVRAMLIGGVKELANMRLNAEHIEVISASFVNPDAGWICARIEPGLRDVISRQTVKAAIAITQIDVVGIRLIRRTTDISPDCVEALRLRHIQRVQYECIHYAENHCIRADRQGQRQNGGEGKSRRPAQQSKREAHVLQKDLNEISAQRFVALL